MSDINDEMQGQSWPYCATCTGRLDSDGVCRRCASDEPRVFDAAGNTDEELLANLRTVLASNEPRATYHFSLTDDEREVFAAVLAEVARLDGEPNGYAGYRGDGAARSIAEFRAATQIREALRLSKEGA